MRIGTKDEMNEGAQSLKSKAEKGMEWAFR